MRGRQLSRATTCLLTVAALASAPACGAGREAAVRPPASPTGDASAERDADEQAAGKAALDAYSGYLAASRTASRRGDPHAPELSRFLADPLLTRVRMAIRETKEHGAMRTGTLKSDPTVTAVSLDSVPATVEIQDCLDATGYRLVYVKNQRAVPGSDGKKYLATATATRYPDGRWRINAGAAHQDQPC
ncbi:hypothetical protein [Micromonospora sp. WMMD812]|uniref:hypothetical protein n=1 Tax=Micromonospora sp. WMMD812 TaxID=3015152 RepID=UPI00248B44D6|nr:hypothetical protein [Micromonospora sp. WMMD812]WBB65547.1 hypothetical protein O7603_20355 [Micromonospora sp. WMMD812]